MPGEMSRDDVFINCPFDAEFAPTFRALIFRIMACGFRPRCPSGRGGADAIRQRVIAAEFSAKAASWKVDFGLRQVVPTAILSGVYKLHNLIDAQQRGLTIFWAHNLQAMTDWIAATK